MTLDIDGRIADGSASAAFQAGIIPLPALTLIAVEEPENSLALFYLSRIVCQIEQLTVAKREQAFISSRSASILARVDPARAGTFGRSPPTEPCA
ncbi:hypothetical protein ACE10Z_37100 [Bradyrhizobium sp. Pha-3]|uniref:hypothetical protein n=1 Tax=Bradyrhizobium sp. Pha-3 TaxID=208375 RepID=UPI0035D520DE